MLKAYFEAHLPLIDVRPLVDAFSVVRVLKKGNMLVTPGQQTLLRSLMTTRNILFPFLFLVIVLACQPETRQDDSGQINKQEESFVMLLVTPKSTGDMVRTLKIINGQHGHADLRMSSTSVHSDTGDQDFLIVRGFPDFNAADAYVRLLHQQRISGSPFAIPKTQYNACMVSMDFNKYREDYRKMR